jgi:hypothetical protein
MIHCIVHTRHTAMHSVLIARFTAQQIECNLLPSVHKKFWRCRPLLLRFALCLVIFFRGSAALCYCLR